MQLNHINLVMPDVAAACTFFERYFGFTAGGYSLERAPQKIRNGFGFYFRLQNIMIEISAPGVE